MINKVSDEWDQIENSLARNRGQVDQRLTEPPVKAKDFEKAVLDRIGGVREVLRRMCQVSVTRTTVRNAVREALMPLIKEHREELFPELREIAELKRNIERSEAKYKKVTLGLFRRAPEVPDEVREQLQELEERVRRISEIEESLEAVSQEMGGRMDEADGQMQEIQGRVKDVEGRAEGADRRMTTIERQASDKAAEAKETAQRLGSLIERFDVQRLELNGQKETLAQAEDRLAELEAHAGSVDDRLSENRTQLDSLRQMFSGVEERTTRSEERLGQVNGRIGQVEGHVSRVEIRVEQLEKDLRKEIDDMVQALTEKLAVLHEMMGRMEQTMPHRSAVSTANERLQGLEERLQAVTSKIENVASKVDSIDSVTPEVRGMGRQFDELRERLASLSGDVGRTGGRLGNLEGEFTRQISELSGLLQTGIAKWESDQSHTLERLSVMRDALRDQLRSVGEQVAEAKSGLLGKLTRKKEGSLKLSRGEWDQMASKMEGIVAGLESVLAKKKGELS